MILRLLTEHHLEFLSLKEGCKGSPEYTCQNATLLEITCHAHMLKLTGQELRQVDVSFEHTKYMLKLTDKSIIARGPKIAYWDL